VQAAPRVSHVTLLPLLSSRHVLRKYAFATIHTYVAVRRFLFKFNARKQIGRYPSQKTSLNILEKEDSLSWKNSIIGPQPLQEIQFSPLRTWIRYIFTTRFTLKETLLFLHERVLRKFPSDNSCLGACSCSDLFLCKCERFHTTLVQAAPSSRAPILSGSTRRGSTRPTEFGFCKSAKQESVGSQKYLLQISQARTEELWINIHYLSSYFPIQFNPPYGKCNYTVHQRKVLTSKIRTETNFVLPLRYKN